MIQIMECTDCKHCANFDYGYRVYCLHPNLPAEEVCKYSPVENNKSADKCENFEEGDDKEFGYLDIESYEFYCIQKYGVVNYTGIREWIENWLLTN